MTFLQVMRELDLAAIQRQFAAPIRVLVTGPDPGLNRQLAETLFGSDGPRSWSVALASLDESEASPPGEQPNLVLLAVPGPSDALPAVQRLRARARGVPAPVVAVVRGPAIRSDIAPLADPPPAYRLVASRDDNPAALARTVATAALDLAPDLALPLGRRVLSLRPTVAERLIREASRANGQFALVSSLPANLPFIGGLVGDMADMVVLTKNQALLVYKLAGLHGRDLEQRTALALEIAPVVGGAFFWRSLARALLGLLPGVVGGLPKAVVAYAGTYAVGQIARSYYATGHPPSPELIARFQADGARLASGTLARLRDRFRV